jgi:phthiocerol/phenolphthiocerol synthesis type-I polyketide synthase E
VSASSPSGIAVVGLACRFPGAPDPETFWRNLRDGVESISFFSEEELRASGVQPSLRADPRYVPAKGVLDDIESFDAGFFHFTPLEAERMDPQHRVFLEACWQALEDAGCDPTRFPGPIGVFGGETLGAYFFHLASHPRIGASVATLQNMIGLDREFLTTLVSYKLDLRGPSFTLQTACSTSLVAVCVACQSLKSYECDLALAGGVSIRVPPRTGYLYQQGGIQSPDGHCRAFDADAQGTVGGDGAGVVALKRLEDALRDGDPIRAVIRGWALNNDGSNKLGFTAPSIEGQAEAVAVAQALAGVEPDTITFVEGHGTGTPLGDPIEVAALTRVFRESTQRRSFCALGAVKSNVGHLDAAAGVAGLIKTALALEHAEIPPTLHFRRPNPELRLESSPFYVNSTLIPWPATGDPRRAGVSSFGLGGTNAHVVVEEAPRPEPADAAEPVDAARAWHLLVLSARSAKALDAAAANLAAWIGRHPGAHPEDVAWTLQSGRRAFPHRRVLVDADLAAAARRLPGGSSGEAFTSVAAERRPAFLLFPGHGLLRAGMGRELYREEPGFRRRIDLCARSLRPLLGVDLREVLHPPAGGEVAAEHQLARFEVGHPALFALEYALAGLWSDWGVKPAAMIGHSLGEWTAACLAGVFSVEDALSLLAARGRLMDALPEGAMLSVPLPEREVLSLLREGLELSGVNAPSLCSVSGPAGAVERLGADLEARGVLCRRVDATRAFHSSALEPVARELVRLVAGVERRPPTIPFLSNRTGTWITPGQAVDPEYWGFHVRHAVRFGDGMAELLRSGDGALLEAGPGGSLGSLARRQPELLGQRPVLASLPRPREGAPEERQPEPVSVLNALGRFWAAGGTVDWAGFQQGRRQRRVPLPTYPFERLRYWVDLPGDTRELAAGPLLPDPAAAAEPAAEPAEPAHPAEPAGRPGHGRPDIGIPYEAPRSGIERRLAGLWTEVLGIDLVGVHDDFYELGGDSLRALDLLARVRAAFGAELPLRTLLEATTVARLAERLPGTEPSGAPAVRERRLPGGLVAIQEGNGGPPLFLVHPAGGHVLGYRPLAERLGGHHPVYGLEALGALPGETPHETIEEMAAAHVAALLELGHRGSLVLGGASMGGTVAWEMARQLRERGGRVALVALFDTPGPGQIEREPADGAEVLVHLGAGHLGLTAEDLRRLPPEQRLPRALELAQEAGLIPPGLDLARAASLVELFNVHLRAMLRYRPGEYAGRVAFFRAAERRPADPPHPELGWIDLAGDGIEVHVVPGNHGTMYLPPHVDTLARRLRRCLEGTLEKIR